jgi:hypothetical protein
VIIMPVKFAKPQGASASDLEDLQALTDRMHAALVHELGQVLEVVTEPGPGALRVETSLYDAQKKQTAETCSTRAARPICSCSAMATK